MTPLTLLFGIVLSAALPTIGAENNWRDKAISIVAEVEPLHLPSYERKNSDGAILENHGQWRVATVFYQVKSDLVGDKLMADVVRQFIQADWAAGPPKEVSGGGELAFHREDFSPAPRTFAIYCATLSISKDEKSIRCSYWFRSR